MELKEGKEKENDHLLQNIRIIDGALGTEIKRKTTLSLKESERDDSDNVDIYFGHHHNIQLHNPELLYEIHSDYINAGAEIITTNTYACNKHCICSTQQSILTDNTPPPFPSESF